MSEPSPQLNELKALLVTAVGELGERYDAEKIVEYLAQFLIEAKGKPPQWFVQEAEGAAAAFVILEDVAREEPILTGSKCDVNIGVPKKIAEIFTWGLCLGVFLSSKGSARWPTKTLNS